MRRIAATLLTQCAATVSGGLNYAVDAMGFNPYRKFVAKRADYVFVVAAVATCVALVAWALLG